MNTKNIAIVGANSILGQAIHKRLVGEYNVYQVYHTNVDNIKSNRNLLQIDDFLKSGFTYDIIYFISAVISSEENSEKIIQMFQTNVLLLKTISNTFKSAKLINASSVSVFQESNYTITELSPVLPKSSYAVTKLWSEQIVTNHAGGGVNIRMSSLYGVGMKCTSFLPKMIKSATQNKQITIFGNGSRRQNYISSKEAADYFYEAIQYAGTMPLLAVGNQSYSNIEMANLVCELVPQVKIVMQGNDDSSSFTYDNSTTKKVIISIKEYSFYELIKEVVEWMQKQY
jgi:nucleoside-diphosphate-sugar epimerase